MGVENTELEDSVTQLNKLQEKLRSIAKDAPTGDDQVDPLTEVLGGGDEHVFKPADFSDVDEQDDWPTDN